MKYIYLDQNKWIELAKGIKSNDSQYIELYNIIMKNVENGVWAFPLSLIHIIETMKRKDKTSREEILNLMFLVSKEYAICNYATADEIEFNCWVNNKSIDCSILKNEMIACDWEIIFGLSITNEQRKIKKRLSSPRKYFNYICNMARLFIADEEFYYNRYQEARRNFWKWKNEIKQLDEYKDKHLYPAYLIKIFFEIYKEKMMNMSAIERENIKELFEKSEKNKTVAIANLETIPGFNVYNRLVFELFNNPQKDVHKHDFNDLAYLRVAVPYCDIVIGEKYWCDRVCANNLDKKYNTTISTKLLSLI